MHGFIWDNEGIALNEWKNGYTYEGEYMSKRAITYTNKYMLKINKKDKLYVPKIMCSAGIGKKWTEGIGAERAKYVPHGTLEEFRYRDWETDRKSTRLNSSHRSLSRMPSSA